MLHTFLWLTPGLLHNEGFVICTTINIVQQDNYNVAYIQYYTCLYAYINIFIRKKVYDKHYKFINKNHTTYLQTEQTEKYIA